MMIKRIVCFLSVFIVATSSAFAWDAYSFTGVYDVSSSAPVLYADTSSQTSFDGQWMMQHITSPNKVAFICEVYHEEVYIPPIGVGGDITIPAFTEYRDYPSNGSTPSFGTGNWSGCYWYNISYSDDVPHTQNGGDVQSVGSLIAYPFNESQPNYWFTYNLDISSISEFYAFQLSGSMTFDINLTVGSETNWDESGMVFEIYVNDTLQRTFTLETNTLDLSDYLYSGSSPVTSIYFRVYFPSTYLLYPEGQSSVSCQSNVGIGFSDSAFLFSILQVDDVLVGAVDQAQDDINSHESIESQWTGSMSSNFDALDMDSFSFPSGLLSGFSLITGIFQDLWNGMGDYKILYVFPLFLGIALLLIGRISKFSGGQSSSRSNRGDDDA